MLPFDDRIFPNIPKVSEIVVLFSILIKSVPQVLRSSKPTLTVKCFMFYKDWQSPKSDIF